MGLKSVARKLLRTLARIVPQCGMVSQAVAFNMFLAFFPMLLFGLGLLSSSLRGENGKEIAARLSEILPPGSWQLVSDFLFRRAVPPLPWPLFGAARSRPAAGSWYPMSYCGGMSIPCAGHCLAPPAPSWPVRR